MNATEKAHALRNAGYELETMPNNFVWRDKHGNIAGDNESNNKAINEAYKHLLRKNSMITTVEDEYYRAQLEAEQAQESASETAQSETLIQPYPKYTVGQLVEAYGYSGKIMQIRQLQEWNDGSPNEYTFEDSFPSNAWFAEVELTPVYDDMATEKLRNQIDELRAELEVQKTRNEALEEIYRNVNKENGHLRFIMATIRNRCQRPSTKTSEIALDILKTLDNKFVQELAKQSPEAPKADEAKPKFQVGDKVRIVSHIDKVIAEILKIENNGEYRVKRGDSDALYWYEEKDLAPYTDAPANHGGDFAPDFAEQLNLLERVQNEPENKPDAPAVEEVTLTKQEIEWLGRQYVPMSGDFRAYVFSQESKNAPFCVIRMGETKNGMIRYQLVPEKRTDANMKAIENKRKELLGE